jgi:hypothetical protein
MAFHDPNTWSAPGKWTSVTAAGVVVLSFEGTIVRLLDLSQWTILLVRGPLMAVGLGVIFWLGWAAAAGMGDPRAGSRRRGPAGWALIVGALAAHAAIGIRRQAAARSA